MMTAVTKLALGLLAATTVAADSRLNLRFSPLLISSLVAATADAAYLRKAGQSRDSASDSRPESRRLDDADCMDDPEWYHKNRGPEYDCAWVALKTDTRCSVKGVSGKVEGTIVASEACKEACGTCGGGGGGGDVDFSDDVDNVVFAHDSVLDDFLGETLLMDAHRSGKINYLGSIVVNADSVLPSSMDLVYKFRELYGADMYVGLSPSRMFYPFPWIYRADSYSMDSLDVMQAVTPSGPNAIPATYPDGNEWLEETLESAPAGSITLNVGRRYTPLQELFTKKPYLADKIKRMVWMAGAIDVPGNLEPACDSFRCAPYFFPHCTEDMGWCEVCDPEVSGHCTGFPEWNVFVDPYATAYLFTETSFPIAIVPLDVCDKLPIPGDFMDTLRAANSSECNQGIYEALLVSYDTFAAEQPFYRLWDSGAVMYYLDPEDYGEPEVTEICIGTSWTYLGGLFRKSKVDEDVPPCVEINQ